MTKEQRQLWDSIDATAMSKDDWRDLHETIEAFERRRTARAIARHPQRAQLVEMIRTLAGFEDGDEVEVGNARSSR